MEYFLAAARTARPLLCSRMAAFMRFSRSEGMSIDAKLKGDEDGLINLSIGVLVAVLSTSEAVGGVEDGDTLLVAQVWVGPSGGCRTYT